MDHLLLFIDWWTQLSGLRQTFWTLAIVASLLLLILVAASLMGRLYDSETAADHKETEAVWINARWVLTFFAFFGWAGLCCSYLHLSMQWSFMISVSSGALAALLSRRVALFLIRHPRLNPAFEPVDLRESLGEVLQSIPPHRNGFGKVHLDRRGIPFEIEAITAGQELPTGVPIRVIDVIDGRVLLVEPIPDEPYPGQSAPQEPPGN